MAARQAAGTAGGSTKHTQKQDETPAPEQPETPAAADSNPLGAFTEEQVLKLLDVWKAQYDEERRALAAVSDHADLGHTSELRPAQLEALEKLRTPFPAEAISKRPAPWCKACNNAPDRVCGQHKKIKCAKCDTWITEAHNDLDYVGHAGITDRLLSVDPTWDWEPLSVDEHGHPLLDARGGLWIKLTVCGMTRKGYGDAPGKNATTTAMKEIIGDAIRNAAMRFGMALELWSKVDLHKESEPPAHPADRFVDAIKEARVWTSEQWLAGVRQDADEAGQLDYAVPGGHGTTLGQIIDEQLAKLADSARIEAELRVEREEKRKAAAAQIAAEHGATPRNAGAPPAGNPAPPDPITEAEVRTVCTESWLLADALERALAAGEASGVVDVPSRPDEPDGPTLGQAMRRQIRELHRAAAQRTGTSRAVNAANQHDHHSDWRSSSERAG